MSPAEKLSSKRKPKPTKDGVPSGRKTPFICHAREIRLSLGLSIRDVCDAIEMSVGGMFEIERGTDPQVTTALKISAFYGKTVHELWERRI